jgi:hypothetical protein
MLLVLLGDLTLLLLSNKEEDYNNIEVIINT